MHFGHMKSTPPSISSLQRCLSEMLIVINPSMDYSMSRRIESSVFKALSRSKVLYQMAFRFHFMDISSCWAIHYFLQLKQLWITVIMDLIYPWHFSVNTHLSFMSLWNQINFLMIVWFFLFEYNSGGQYCGSCKRRTCRRNSIWRFLVSSFRKVLREFLNSGF